jgi:glucose/arabinose dehydrogenase
MSGALAHRGRAPALVAMTGVLAAVVALAPGAGGFAAGAGNGAAGEPARGGLQLERLGTARLPVHIAQAPGQQGTLYVVEQPGRVVVVRDGEVLPHPFLDITDRVLFGREAGSWEAGMFSIAFAPRYRRTGRFYVFHTDPRGSNRVVEYRRSPGNPLRALRASARPVLVIPHPFTDHHNGGQLQFGPDGHLWVSTGDGECCGDPNDQARNLETLLGKLLRIDPRRAGPGFRAAPGNPLVQRPGRDAIYAWGLRNPWRFSFDRLTGDLAITDVGDDSGQQEEINFLSTEGALGANFGWPEYEGFKHRDPTRPGMGTPSFPVQVYGRRDGACAITGGYIVRDPSLKRLWGRYVYSDFCRGVIRSLVPPTTPGAPATDDRDERLFVRFPTSFGEGLDGQIYVASRSGGIFRIVAKGRRAADRAPR